jgi:hypothetical protein
VEGSPKPYSQDFSRSFFLLPWLAAKLSHENRTTLQMKILEKTFKKHFIKFHFVTCKNVMYSRSKKKEPMYKTEFA